MRYCTRQDLIDTYGAEQLTRLTDRVNMPATTIDDALVDKAILHAEGEINMYLEGRYRLPLNKGSVMLTRIACDLAWFNLHTQVDDDHPAVLGYKRRKSQLDGVASGKLSIGLDGDDGQVPIANTVQVAPGRQPSRDGKEDRGCLGRERPSHPGGVAVMLVWPMPPEWSEPVKERLAWLTDVLLAKATGITQHRQLRLSPRRAFSFQVVATENERVAHCPM